MAETVPPTPTPGTLDEGDGDVVPTGDLSPELQSLTSLGYLLNSQKLYYVNKQFVLTTTKLIPKSKQQFYF